MKLHISPAPKQYSQEWQAQHDRALIDADLQNMKRNTDVEFVDNRLILRSPDGTRFKLKVSNAGVLSTDPL